MNWVILVILFMSCNSVEDIDIDIQGVDDFNENEIGSPRIIISRENVPVVKATSEILIKNNQSNISCI